MKQSQTQTQNKFRTVPNQKIIKVQKAPCSDKPEEYYSKTQLAAEKQAMKNLSYEAFKMWRCFAINADSYEFALSRKRLEEECGFVKYSYDKAIKELIEKRYLVNECGNFYCFHENIETLGGMLNEPLLRGESNEPRNKDAVRSTNYDVVYSTNHDVVCSANHDVVCSTNEKYNNNTIIDTTKNITNNITNSVEEIFDRDGEKLEKGTLAEWVLFNNEEFKRGPDYNEFCYKMEQSIQRYREKYKDELIQLIKDGKITFKDINTHKTITLIEEDGQEVQWKYSNDYYRYYQKIYIVNKPRIKRERKNENLQFAI